MFSFFSLSAFVLCLASIVISASSRVCVCVCVCVVCCFNVLIHFIMSFLGIFLLMEFSPGYEFYLHAFCITGILVKCQAL